MKPLRFILYLVLAAFCDLLFVRDQAIVLAIGMALLMWMLEQDGVKENNRTSALNLLLAVLGITTYVVFMKYILILLL